jgi:hypothetical protein
MSIRTVFLLDNMILVCYNNSYPKYLKKGDPIMKRYHFTSTFTTIIAICVSLSFISCPSPHGGGGADADMSNYYTKTEVDGLIQWMKDGNNIYNKNTDNVGIGTSTPGTNRLQVNGNLEVSSITINGVPVSTSSDTCWTSNAGDIYYDGGNVGIGTSSPEFKLSIGNDGGIIAKGTYGSGATLTTTGQGARFIWYPQKAALRAGYAGNTEWNDANIGNCSTALGEITTASGNCSTALGFYTIASGNESTAMGYETTASGPYSTAMGEYTSASAFCSTAMGYQTRANGSESTAMGQNTTASGDVSTAMGRNTTASGDVSTAMGRRTTAQANGSLVIGRNNVISGTPDTWIETEPLFVAGNGPSESEKSNAFTLFKDGRINIGGDTYRVNHIIYATNANGARLTTGGVWTDASSRDYKENITRLTTEEAFGALKKLEPVKYNYRVNKEEEYIGFIAEDVPGLVATNDRKSLSSMDIVAVLTKVVKEQQRTIVELEKRIAELEK